MGLHQSEKEETMASNTPSKSNGTSHPFNSSLEQNIIAISKIFDNITFDKLAKLLNTDKNTVEKTAAEMVNQGRLKASLDQAHSLIYFQKSEDVVSIDQQFLRACQESNTIYNRILEKYPEWYAKKFPESVSQ
uniref:PCI domain-containing protein n=1 Tax=Panagrolaimus sp. PS1159 TaxID=55785 RepID=A0AC35FLF9_9BILA